MTRYINGIEDYGDIVVGDLTMSDGEWIGLGSSAERIQWNDSGNSVNIEDANFIFNPDGDDFGVTLYSNLGKAFTIDGATGNIALWSDSASGETPSLSISGFKAGDALRTASFNFGDAADTLSIEGVSNYYIGGNLGVNGVSTPNFELTVNGQAQIKGGTTAGIASLDVESSDPTLRLKMTGTVVADKNTWDIRSNGLTGVYGLYFRTINDAENVFTERVRFENDGNLLLGSGSASGVTPELKIYGYKTGDSLRSLEIGVGVDAADTASFDGLSNYLFDGEIQSSSAKIGDSTNYTEVKSDGEINLHGTARVKKSIRFEGQQLATGSTPPDSSSVGNYEFFQYDIGDDSVINIPMPLDWCVGTDIEVHIRWGINETYATGSGEVQWRVDWSAVPNDGSEAIDSPNHSGQVDSGDINIPATAKAIQETTITIPGTNIVAIDDLGVTLSRIALVGGSNPTADPGVICVGIVYISDKLGSAT